VGLKSRWLILGIFALFFLGCERPLRLPYIPPELHSWPKPYKGTRGLKLHVFTTGSLEVPRALLVRGGSWLRRQELDILAFLIEHPSQGFILFNTGLNREIAEDPERYMGPLLVALTRPKMAEGQDLFSQIEQAGLPTERVSRIVVSDLRLDHTGELERFPSAEVIVTQIEYDVAQEQRSNVLYREAEYNHVRRWKFIDYIPDQPIGTFTSHIDLLGDGSLILIDAAGATPGNQALLVRLPSQPVLLCGSLALIRENYLYAGMPRLLFDREAWWEKIWRLKKFKDLVPELLVFPDHDLKAVESAKAKDVMVHPFVEEEKDREKKPQKKQQRPGQGPLPGFPGRQ
jgi:glyoxylase-like metal-dependent hydrolase (beta-lactamase superfamily II)